MLKRSQPIFAVRDVKATIAFYQDVLGFRGPWFWGEPVCFGGIHWGDVHVMFNQQPDLAARIEGLQHHYWSDEIDALHELHRSKAAPIISPIDNKPWGIREYTVRDPDGYHLRFSGPPAYERPPTALDTMPATIRVEPRLPTPDECRDLKRAVGWDAAHDDPSLLGRCCAGVVAVDASTGQAVGMARAVNDARAWYSVWDVIVRPAYQNQRIGTALMEALLGQLRATAPAGSIVFLFTFKHGFYEKLGFKTDTCTSIRL